MGDVATSRFTLPLPNHPVKTPVLSTALLLNRAFSCCQVSSGCCWSSNAAEPVTSGVDRDVPRPMAYRSPSRAPARAPRMPVPGAAISGFCRQEYVGPMLVNRARLPAGSSAPTVNAESAVPGVSTENGVA